MKKQNKTKQNNDEQLSPGMVIKIHEIRRKRLARLWCEGFMVKVSFESGVEHRWSDA